MKIESTQENESLHEVVLMDDAHAVKIHGFGRSWREALDDAIHTSRNRLRLDFGEIAKIIKKRKGRR